MARPSFQATSEERTQVEALAAYGIPQEDICLLIKRPAGKSGELKPITPKTLRKHFSEELATSTPKFIGLVAQRVRTIALDTKHPKSFEACRFILKARGGWSERSELEVNGSLDLDLSGATREELAVIERFLKRKVEERAGFSAANAA